MNRAIPAKYVLDASVAAKWFTRHAESDRQQAIALRRMHLEGRCTLVIPEFALLEILNAIRYSDRALESDVLQALGFLRNLRLEVVPLSWELLHDATTIAWSHGVALYDAAYLALAERMGFLLLTADEAMIRKMKGHGSVLPIRDLELDE